MRVGYHGRPNVATTVAVISAHWKRRIPWGCRRRRCCKRKGLRYQLACEWYTVHVKPAHLPMVGCRLQICGQRDTAWGSRRYSVC